tara:strand:+ start:547 stop:1143 length:597 start_codon:yes stop_codon:yes gene_type:complete
MIKKFKFKKLLNEFRSLKYEKKYVESILEEWNPKFDLYHDQYCDQFEIDIKTLNDSNKKQVQQIFKNERAISKGIEKSERKKEFDSKNLFRQIARKFHPDKIDIDDPKKQEYEDVFKRASNAIDNAEWGDLFDVADEYDLDLKNYDEIIKCLKSDIKRIKKEINAKKNTYAWLLYECEENENCKQNIMKRFLNHLFKI